MKDLAQVHHSIDDNRVTGMLCLKATAAKANPS